MNPTQWNPYQELEGMLERLNRLLGPRGSTQGDGRETITAAEWTPAVDVFETDQEFRIEVELPGVRKEAGRVDVHDGVVTIRGERERRSDDRATRRRRSERQYGIFQRSFTLPPTVEASKVSAEFHDGVLNVRLPKSETAKPKAIEVKVA